MKKKKTRTKKNQNVKNSIITVELTAIVLLAVYLIGYTVTMLNKPSIVTEVVSYGQIEAPKLFAGIIARDEAVTFAEEAGQAFYSYTEQDYAKKGSIVCVTKESGSAEILEKEIIAINDGILEKQVIQNDSATELDEVKRINVKIKNEIDRQAPLFYTYGGDDLSKLKNQLNKDISLRSSILISNGNDALNSLNDQKTAYERQLMEGTKQYTADFGGVVSYNIDGYEQLYTPETVFELTKEDFNAPPSTAIREVGDSKIDKGEPIYKIIRSNIWYIAAYFDKEITADWKEGNSRYLYIKDENGKRRISMRIETLTPVDTQMHVVFSSTKYMNEFLNRRHIEFCLDDDAYKGLKVPNTAITEKTAVKIPEDFIYDFRGVNGVYVKGENNYVHKGVNILSYEDGFANVLQDFESIKLGAVIYSRSDDGKTIGGNSFTIEDITGASGVYVANSGTAEFRQVVTIAANEYYSIINKGKSYGVKPYDRIVTDAGSIENNKILR